MSSLASIAPVPSRRAATATASTDMYFNEHHSDGMPSLTLPPLWVGEVRYEPPLARSMALQDHAHPVDFPAGTDRAFYPPRARPRGNRLSPGVESGGLHVACCRLQAGRVVEAHPEAPLNTLQHIAREVPVGVVAHNAAPSWQARRQGRADAAQLC